MKKFFSILCALAIVLSASAVPQAKVPAGTQKVRNARALTLNVSKDVTKKAKASKIAKAKKEVTDVTIATWSLEDWGTDGEFYLYNEGSTICFYFDLIYGGDAESLIPGKEYTVADIYASEYKQYAGVYYDGNWHDGIKELSIVKTIDEQNLVHFVGSVLDSLNRAWTFHYDEPEPANTYYIKNNWDGGREWSWKEMARDTNQESEFYSLKNVVFGGTGVTISADPENDVNPLFIATENIQAYDNATFEVVALGALDTVSFFFEPGLVDPNTGANGLTAYVTGKYVEPAEPSEPVVENKWTEIAFTEAVASDELAEDATFAAQGSEFFVTITDINDKMSIDANHSTFGSIEENKTYTHRLKAGGKSNSNNFITISIPADGKLRIAVRSGSNSATDRNLVLTQNGVEIYNSVVLEDDAIVIYGEEYDTKIYPYITVPVRQGWVEVTHPTGSLNFYAFAFTEDEYVEPEPQGQQERVIVAGLFPAENCPADANIEIAGTFAEGAVGMERLETGWFANFDIHATEDNVFKFRDATNNDLVLCKYNAEDDKWEQAIFKFGDVWSDDSWKGEPCKFIEIDLSDAGQYAWIENALEPVDPSEPIAVTCAEAVAAMPAQTGSETEEVYIVTGYITETNGTISRGQQTFWMDDVKGSKKTFEGYWCNLPAAEVDANRPLNIGDKITVTGKIFNYNNLAEIKNGDVTILKRASEDPIYVPSDEVLADYYEAGNVCVCIYVPAHMACNDIVLTGSFNDWNSIVEECPRFEPVAGYDGWYVTSFVPEAEPEMERGIQAKPIMLDVDGGIFFNWDYLVGAATVIRGAVEVVQGAYAGEIDLLNYGTDAPNVFKVDAWRKNPCTSIYHNYHVEVISDGCDGLVVPYIVGPMTGWDFQQMRVDVAKTQELAVPVYYFDFKAAEETPYQILSGLLDPNTGEIVEAASWNAEARMQQLVDGMWVQVSGEDGENQLTHQNANIVWDLREENLCWARCVPEEPDEYVVFAVNLPTENFPATGAEIIGTFDGWEGTLLEKLETGWYFVELNAKASQFFKFKSAGSWDQELECYDVESGEWRAIIDKQFVFGQLWQDDSWKGVPCKFIEIDLSDPERYRWSCDNCYPSQTNVVVLSEVANYIDFQALSISDPAMTDAIITSTNYYTLANGTVLKGFQKSDGSETSVIWNVKEYYNDVRPTPEWEGVDSLIVGTMLRAGAGTSIELGSFYTENGKIVVYFSPNGDSERGISLSVYGEELAEVIKSGAKIGGVRPAYAAEFYLPAGQYEAGDVVIRMVGNTSNIFGISIDAYETPKSLFTIRLDPSSEDWENAYLYIWMNNSCYDCWGSQKLVQAQKMTLAEDGWLTTSFYAQSGINFYVGFNNRQYSYPNYYNSRITYSESTCFEFDSNGNLQETTYRKLTPDESNTFVVHVATPGTFGQMMVQEMGDRTWTDVAALIVTGSLNDQDMSYFYRMTQLQQLDLSGTDITHIGGCKNLTKLTSVVLPETCIAIDNNAFNGCKRLKSINLEKIQSVGDYSFYQASALAELNMPRVISVGNYAFAMSTEYYDLHNSSLQAVHMPIVQTIGNYAFCGQLNLAYITMPLVTTIGSYAFSNCCSLTQVDLSNVTSLGEGAFYMYDWISDYGYWPALSEVILSEELETIPYGCFNNCQSLNYIQLPSSLQLIGNNALPYLAEVELPENITTVGNGNFMNATSITIPAKVTNWDSYSTTWKDVYCHVVVPRTFSSFNNDHVTEATLHVPAVSLAAYKLHDNWYRFGHIVPIEGDLDNIVINDPFTLISTAGISDSANLTIAVGGSLIMSAADTLSIGQYEQTIYSFNKEYGRNERYENGNYYSYYYNTLPFTGMLLAKSQIMADGVTVKLVPLSDHWNFFSLPFDVKMSDITIGTEGYGTPGTSQWVIREYSGANRASGNGSTWNNVPANGTLKAHTGYILYWVVDNSGSGDLYYYFNMPAVPNDAMQHIFATGDVNVPLAEYSAEFPQNRSWNLVGNPYPCSFDIKHMEFEAPITVWNGSGYTAVTTTDDDYLLRPAEAFFVQAPQGVSQIPFHQEGRNASISTEISYEEYYNGRYHAPRRIRSGSASRQVFNIFLSDNEYSDRARLVHNENASASYETTRDAAKMMSSDKSVPQLYINDNGIRYAIDERPAQETYSLGAFFGKDGEYVIKLQSDYQDGEILLIDKELQTKTDLTQTEYTFQALQGNADNRFEIKFAPRMPMDLDQTNSLMCPTKTLENGMLIITTPQGKKYTVGGQAL